MEAYPDPLKDDAYTNAHMMLDELVSIRRKHTIIRIALEQASSKGDSMPVQGWNTEALITGAMGRGEPCLPAGLLDELT